MAFICKKVREIDLTLIYHQFCPDLAIIYHTPYEVMRLSAILAKNVKKVCDNNLPYAGYGALCGGESAEVE